MLVHCVIHATKPLHIFHFDVWVSPSVSSNGYTYYVYFIDELLRYTWIYFLKTKTVGHEDFMQFKAQAELQISCKIQILQSDWEENFKC